MLVTHLGVLALTMYLPAHIQIMPKIEKLKVARLLSLAKLMAERFSARNRHAALELAR